MPRRRRRLDLPALVPRPGPDVVAADEKRLKGILQEQLRKKKIQLAEKDAKRQEGLQEDARARALQEEQEAIERRKYDEEVAAAEAAEAARRKEKIEIDARRHREEEEKATRRRREEEEAATRRRREEEEAAARRRREEEEETRRRNEEAEAMAARRHKEEEEAEARRRREEDEAEAQRYRKGEEAEARRRKDEHEARMRDLAADPDSLSLFLRTAAGTFRNMSDPYDGHTPLETAPPLRPPPIGYSFSPPMTATPLIESAAGSRYGSRKPSFSSQLSGKRAAEPWLASHAPAPVVAHARPLAPSPSAPVLGSAGEKMVAPPTPTRTPPRAQANEAWATPMRTQAPDPLAAPAPLASPVDSSASRQTTHRYSDQGSSGRSQPPERIPSAMADRIPPRATTTPAGITPLNLSSLPPRYGDWGLSDDSLSLFLMKADNVFSEACDAIELVDGDFSRNAQFSSTW